jgi:hypothetical protein
MRTACNKNAPQAQKTEYHNDLPIINAKLPIPCDTREPESAKEPLRGSASIRGLKLFCPGFSGAKNT